MNHRPTLLAVVVSCLAGALPLAAQEEQGAEPGAAPAGALRAPEVTLLEAGAAPRRELRLRPEIGKTSRLSTTMRMNVATTVNGMPSGGMPPITMVFVMEMTPTRVEGGDIHYDTVIRSVDLKEEAGMPPQMAGMMREMLRGLNGAAGRGVTTDRGVAKSIEFDIPADANPMVVQQLESFRHSASQFSAPLPAEAVGRGAKWRVVSDLDVQGMKSSQTGTFTLESLEGDVLVVSHTSEQVAERQQIQPPGMPPGTSAEVISSRTTAEGRATMDLASLAPTSGSSKGEGRTEMKITQGGMTMDMVQKVDMDLTIEGGGAE